MNTILVALLSSLLLASASPRSTSTPGTGTAPTGWEEGPVYVDSTDILYLESFPVQVHLLVQGSLPTPCHEAEWAVEEGADGISVRLWSVSDPGAICVDVLEPFEISIPLGSFETADLPVELDGEPVGRVVVGGTPSGTTAPSLVGAGWSFGMCVGYCLSDLVVDGDHLVLTGTDRREQATLFVNEGALTPAGRERIDAAVAALGDVILEPVYGCPDCADGGAAYLSFARDGVASRHEMEFGEPPAEIAELHEIAMSLIGSLERCETTELVHVAEGCVPVER
jgi:hypothetical protein